jgi:hypothetical protein
MIKPSTFLLTDPSACLRRLVLLELMGKDLEDGEVQELNLQIGQDALVRDLVEKQNPDGSWNPECLGRGWGRGNRILATAAILTRLGYLGCEPDQMAVKRGSEYLYAQQLSDGGWPLSQDAALTDEGVRGGPGYSMIPLQTALPLRGLAACGYATDPRSERAYEWLISKRLDDGAWPTGIASGVYGFVGGYRRLAHSRWGCRSNTTGVLACLALHPVRKASEPARRALDLILGRESQEENTLGFEVARLVGAEEMRGFFTYFARFDLAQMLDFSWRVGLSAQDERLSAHIEFVEGLRGPYGLWEYHNRPQASRWVSFDLTRSLMRLEGKGWIGSEPRTPFQPYPRRIRRF